MNAGSPLITDVDATLLTAHSDKEGAAPTFKRGYGHHLLRTFIDHGPTGTGEPLSVLLRPGNAGSNTAADHITVLREALHQIPGHRTGTRPGRKMSRQGKVRVDERYPRDPVVADAVDLTGQQGIVHAGGEKPTWSAWPPSASCGSGHPLTPHPPPRSVT